MDSKRLADIENRVSMAELSPWRIDLGNGVWSGDKKVAVVLTEGYADQLFIANARKDVPDLLEEVKRLRLAADKLCRQVEMVAGYLAGAETTPNGYFTYCEDFSQSDLDELIQASKELDALIQGGQHGDTH